MLLVEVVVRPRVYRSRCHTRGDMARDADMNFVMRIDWEGGLLGGGFAASPSPRGEERERPPL